MPTEVLHILGSGGLNATSIVRIIRQLAARVDPNRYRIHAYFLGGDGPVASGLREATHEVSVINWRFGCRDPWGAARFWWNLPKRDWKIVHLHYPTFSATIAGYGGRSVRWISRRLTGAKLAVHVHSHERRGSAQALEWSEIHLPDVDTVIAVSREAAGFVRGNVAQVVYPGVCIPSRSARQATILPRPLVIGAACRLVPDKGLVYLIRALPELRDRCPQVRLEIAGAGPEETLLREECRLLEVSDAVTFLGWQQDLASSYARWDVFVSSSLNEGAPLAVLEAMAAGLPIVATEAGGTPEIVEHGRTGWVCPMADPAGLAQRIGELLACQEMREAMGNAGRLRAQQCFSIQRMVDSITAIYDRLISAPPSN